MIWVSTQAWFSFLTLCLNVFSIRTYPVSLRNLQEFLHKRLAEVQQNEMSADYQVAGRLGPKVVKVDRESACGLCQFTHGDLEVILLLDGLPFPF